MSTHPTPSKAARAYEHLLSKIHSREYAPGHRLVLAAIAEELGMSPVPVREAIRQLEAEEYVTYERNVGARVSTRDRSDYFDAMETQALLEGRATAASAAHLKPEDLAEAREINERMRALLDGGDAAEMAALNDRFHRVLCRRCPNRRLRDLVVDEFNRLEYFRETIVGKLPAQASISVAEHDRILNLIEAGAGEDYLELLVRRHRHGFSNAHRNPGA
ncbi:GntR family transcriptional regulator [Corynebacterium uterequi]|uniref:Transcriptional regulator n=1 Tax=Corynebacterium uterequi TaxID=1072256 RepID=A0A0G3HIE0_9CORY|nr:GntR family transcriptional regulator [Corynebacterium uterequi]AKK11658.1 transcriptional regulator [Corynebacterium uterequi]